MRSKTTPGATPEATERRIGPKTPTHYACSVEFIAPKSVGVTSIMFARHNHRASFRHAHRIKTQITHRVFMKINKQIAAIAALFGLGLTSVAAVAEDHPFTEGPVVSVASIRTEYGKFDDYLKFLDTNWKATQEASKKAGYILSYKVITVEPRGENDPDIYLVVYYKNWAALDGATAKGDAIAAQVDGSTAASNKAAIDRGKMRRVLGSWTGQELDLK
jgi:hypothetical protein